VGVGAVGGRCGIDGERRNLIGHEFLNFVEARDGERASDIQIRRGGTHGETIGVPLDDDVFVLFLDAAVDNRLVRGELEFAHLAVAVDLVAVLQLTLGERALPFVFEFTKPEFEGVGCVDALGSVGLHQA
jgi:hypothetical protein